MNAIISEIGIDKCSGGENLAAYLYGELGRPERERVEEHLAACEACASEFADISFARLDVYEWHRDEFAKMATPRFEIPYVEQPASANWMVPIRAFFSNAGWWSVPAAGFAAVAILFGGWYMSASPVDVAETNAPARPATNVIVPVQTPETGSQQSVSPIPVTKEPDSVVTTLRPKGSRTAAPIMRTATPAATERRPAKPVTARRGSAPRLNDFDDEEDTTLRLGDLLAEIDTRD